MQANAGLYLEVVSHRRGLSIEGLLYLYIVKIDCTIDSNLTQYNASKGVVYIYICV